ncbi:DUF6318 family protein [Nocardioides soli]|uniref:DUF6318 domain-containing protein n=1 Tax=Nocardioides soli TaxID=1036020 RepID=A0A7W4Z3D9_9ACTN|nr:DUF6318 family protein [Nocardioides soli]MBB3044958.1 hypothetical protein [Nocardioides soli]
MIGDVSRTRAVLVALLLSTVGLAGCTDDDPEPAPPLPTTEAPTSPSATTAAPEDPEETVRAWVEARNAALQDGDMAAVRSLTSPTCRSCAGILDPIETVYKNGGHFETAGWTVQAANLKSQTDKSATVSTGLEFAEGRTVPEAGAKPVTYEAEKHIVVFKLRLTNDGWQVRFIGFVS